MTTDVKRGLQIFCVVLAFPVLYLASSGPALLLASKADHHEIAFRRTVRFYSPLLDTAAHAHLQQPLSTYLGLYGLETISTGSPDALLVFPPRTYVF